MVKRLLVFILLVLACLLCLTTCDLFVALFSLSPFPGYLAQAVASVDMREEIERFLGDDYNHWWSDVFVLTNSVGTQGVFLVIRRDPGGQWVYAFNSSLSLIDKGYIDQNTDLHLVDANDEFLVGNILFDGTVHVDPAQPGFIPGYWRNSGIAAGLNYIFWINGPDLMYDTYSTAWVSGTQNQFAVSVGSPYDMQLRGARVDGGNVYLMVHGYDPNQDTEVLRIVETPIGDYPNFFTGPLFTDYSPSKPVKRIRGESRIYYTRKGVVAQSYDSSHYLLTAGGDRIKQFYITHEREPALDFDIAGEYYYIFDEQNFRLYQAATGF